MSMKFAAHHDGAATILSLICVGRLKDWKEAGSRDRFRIVMPGVVAIALTTILLISGGIKIDTRHEDPRRQMTVHN